MCIICLLPRLLHCNEYLNTLGELDGFIRDVVVIVGDFNVDLDRCNQITSLLCDFMSDHGLCSCDMLFRDDVKFTEYDDGLCRSHGLIMLFAPSVSPIEYMMSVLCILAMFFLTTYSPPFFSIKADLLPTLITKSVSSANQCCVDWPRVSDSDIRK